jgi:hypothetical protein
MPYDLGAKIGEEAEKLKRKRALEADTETPEQQDDYEQRRKKTLRIPS